jgi:hypothetical protein
MWVVLWYAFVVWAIMGSVWIFYLAVMKLKQHLAELRWYHLMWAYPFAAVFIVVDFLFRITFGTVMFLDLPDRDTLLFTGLCKAHKNEETWRGRLARFWCRTYLNPFDPSGRHC